MTTDIDFFFREGYLHVPGIFTPDEVAALRAKTDACFENREQLDPKFISYVYGAFVLRRGAEYDPLFASLVERPEIQALASAALGPQPAFNALNVIRNEPGQAISLWHVDDVLELPLPDDIPRFDARIRLPVLWLTIQVALSDIETLEHGPTQFVPGSHYSGRKPPRDEESPTFEGRGPVPVFCKAGDVYLTNHQCWHRGAPNLSERTRYVLQLQYATRWADRRFRGVA
ncbi:phytanoyl-CoA dioxygenase family protein [Armatimonas rosea]|uniref:Phytanoyl-CoA dioxygenase PhyH n=1 Tax=Armatimonas rosea TaxID=685828 RepID=A0A7W9SMR7_ARMRO|nr:hypothetical protein [Armatimonas rosea]